MRERHGHTYKATKSFTYRSWEAMRCRCRDAARVEYKHYGGRGITVCQRWENSFPAFLEDMGERPPGTTLDRVDTDGNYEPGNCRWATMQEQHQHTRRSRIVTFKGRSLTVSAWARILGIDRSTLRRRLDKGIDAELAVSMPVNARCQANRRGKKRNLLPENGNDA